MRAFQIVFMATLSVAWSHRLSTQETIPAGTRVHLEIKAPRVSATAPDTHTVALRGRLVRIADSAMFIARERMPDTVRVARDSIWSLQAVVGRRHPLSAGALIGALMGTAIGAAAIHNKPSYTPILFRNVNTTIPGWLEGGVFGVGAGLLVAAFLHVDRWDTLDSRQISVSLVPHGSGPTLGLVAHF